MTRKAREKGRVRIDWHRVFQAFGALAWLYAPVPACGMMTVPKTPLDDETIKRIFT